MHIRPEKVRVQGVPRWLGYSSCCMALLVHNLRQRCEQSVVDQTEQAKQTNLFMHAIAEQLKKTAPFVQVCCSVTCNMSLRCAAKPLCRSEICRLEDLIKQRFSHCRAVTTLLDTPRVRSIVNY